jgi:hypothetical protein
MSAFPARVLTDWKEMPEHSHKFSVVISTHVADISCSQLRHLSRRFLAYATGHVHLFTQTHGTIQQPKMHLRQDRANDTGNCMTVMLRKSRVSTVQSSAAIMHGAPLASKYRSNSSRNPSRLSLPHRAIVVKMLSSSKSSLHVRSHAT